MDEFKHRTDWICYECENTFYPVIEKKDSCPSCGNVLTGPVSKAKLVEGIDYELIDQQITEILDRESPLKENEYEHGILYLTEKFLLWKWKEGKYESIIIRLNDIQSYRSYTGWGIGGLKIRYDKGEKEKNIPFRLKRGNFTWVDDDGVKSWIATLDAGIPTSIIELENMREDLRRKQEQSIFEGIDYAGGHSAYAEKKRGQVIITPTCYKFQEIKGGKQGDFQLDISLEKIDNISIKTTREHGGFLKTILGGPLVSMALPTIGKYLLIEFMDELGMKQTPLFDFGTDRGEKKKGKVMKAIHSHLQKIRMQVSDQEPLEKEDPLKILKIRFAKGEIGRKEFIEMKQLLEE